MSEIPEDIMRLASMYTARCYQPVTGTWFDVRDVIASAISEERNRNRWQDIATAPHHKNVLVWREDAGEPWVAQYTDETFYDAEAGDSDRMDWFDLAGRYEGVEAPTHWQPLPEAPK